MAVTYSTYNKYGDTGVLDVVNYVEQQDIPVGEIATYVHLGSYLGMSDYTDISFIYDDSVKFKKEIIENKKIEYIIVWEKDAERIGKDMSYFELEKQIGSYYVFKKKL